VLKLETWPQTNADRLARIISRILNDLYSIKPLSLSRRAVFIEAIAKELDDWRGELDRFLDADYPNSSLLIPIYQRQRNILNLTYWHALILTYRPFVLNKPSSPGVENLQIEEGVHQCLKAALNTVYTIDEITQDRQMFRAFWVSIIFAFEKLC